MAYLYLEKTSSTYGNTKIKLEVTKISENINNKPIKISYPNVSKSNQDTTSPKTKFKDLKKILHVVSFSGYVYAQQNADSSAKFYDSNIVVRGDTNSTYLTASEAKNVLIYYILTSSGAVNLYYRGLANSNSSLATSLTNLMNATDTARKVSVVFDKIQFTEIPNSEREYHYKTSDGFRFDEWGPKRYAVEIDMTIGDPL